MHSSLFLFLRGREANWATRGKREGSNTVVNANETHRCPSLLYYFIYLESPSPSLYLFRAFYPPSLVTFCNRLHIRVFSPLFSFAWISLIVQWQRNRPTCLNCCINMWHILLKNNFENIYFAVFKHLPMIEKNSHFYILWLWILCFPPSLFCPHSLIIERFFRLVSQLSLP